MVDQLGEKSESTDQTSGMVDQVGEKSKLTDQTSGMLDYRYEKSKFLDQTLGMVGNRYQNIKTWKISKNCPKIFKDNISIESLQHLKNFQKIKSVENNTRRADDHRAEFQRIAM